MRSMKESSDPSSSPFDLSGKRLWVIGGAGYLGQAVTRQLVQLGAAVLCADLPGRAESFVREAGLAAKVRAVDLDATDTAAVTAFVDHECLEAGAPDGMAVLTFASTAKRLEDLTPEEFDQVNHGNLTSTFVLARAVASRMATGNGGSIVLFSSMYGGVSPDPRIYQPPMTTNPIEYGVNKAGIRQMARYLAVHFGAQGVRCNSLSPGPFPNPSIQRQHPEFVQRLTQKVPMGRIGNATEVAGATAFLLSAAASYVTGVDLPVDGGWTAW